MVSSMAAILVMTNNVSTRVSSGVSTKEGGDMSITRAPEIRNGGNYDLQKFVRATAI